MPMAARLPEALRRRSGLGPALIVGSVVLGPGSILSASRVGCEFAYDLGWVLVGAAVLMAATTALAARLGVTLPCTPCEAVARRAGRLPAALVGIVLFAVVACFQFSNNVGVLAGLAPLVPLGQVGASAVLVALNALTIAAVLGFRRLYGPLEKTMKIAVGVMAVGFLGNLGLAGPSVSRAAAGLVPSWPEGARGAALVGVTALVGTTFSVAAAFYQAYLVRAKGWSRADMRRGTVDSILGIAVLGSLTLVIMTTAAAVLHGRVEGSELRSAADVARLLEPSFGPGAKALFCSGILAGAFSSFLVNAMVGGTVLADGLGLGGEVDGLWARRLTVAALVAGMVVALFVQQAGAPPVRLILVAQSLTVLGNPLLAGILLWLAARPGPDQAPAPRWMLLGGLAGFLVVLALAVRTAVGVWG